MKAISIADRSAAQMTQASIEASRREAVANVEAIDPRAAASGKRNRLMLACCAAADLLWCVEGGLPTDNAAMMLRERLVDAGILKEGGG